MHLEEIKTLKNAIIEVSACKTHFFLYTFDIHFSVYCVWPWDEILKKKPRAAKVQIAMLSAKTT